MLAMRRWLSTVALTALIAYGTVPALAKDCSIKSADYFGWKAEKVSNKWVELTIVPALGGRLMQVSFGGHDFLFVNEQLKGKNMPIDTVHRRWYNYGGDKIWPMPEGSQDEQHWPGAGGSELDEAPYVFEVLSHGAVCSVRLTGPTDSFTGQQYVRDISIGKESPVISFHAVMKNNSGYPRSWSEQSVTQYNTAAPDDLAKVNPKIWGLTLANSASAYLNGYHVRTGMAGGPAYTVENGLFKVHPLVSSGEVWVDSPGGWLAVVDGTSNFTMVERNRFYPTVEYPAKATMLFYATGQRIRQATTPLAPDAVTPPPINYMEAEVNSPVIELAPGESYAMDTQWYPTRMGEGFKATTYSGVIGAPLAATATSAGLVLAGEFGVFYPGKLVAHYYARGGSPIGSAEVGDADPGKPLQLHATVAAPPETARVSLHVVDMDHIDRGPLGEALVDPPPPAAAR
ncbi:MAG: hypothetical protein JWQ42_2628 [Edaphobacter sp.]|nr:hypothetical protein [Edaphobacter sp.]